MGDGRRIGRDEILEYLQILYRVTSWRTVRRWKKRHCFPIRYTHTGIPYIIEGEILMWEIEYQNEVKGRRLST